MGKADAKPDDSENYDQQGTYSFGVIDWKGI
jgi:hypothetical protein